MSEERTYTPPKINILRKKRKDWSFLRFIFKAFFVLIILALLGVAAAWGMFKLITPHYKAWADEYNLEYINQLPEPSIIFDKNGQEIGRIFDENRSYVPLSEISQRMVDALVAQEDSRFWHHHGFDPIGIARAGLSLAQSSEVNQGASSITQQLARNAFDLKKHAKERNESGFGRKIAEIFLAMRIEERYSKKQIIEFYLNRVYFGSGFYGIRTASLGYFGKEPIDLTTREAASIAALIKNPNGLSPLASPEKNRQWRNHVLTRMTKEGYLTPSEAENLKKMDLGLNPKPLTRQVSHIYDIIKNLLIDYLGEERTNTEGLRVYTTLDKTLQDTAIQSMQQTLNQIEKRPGYAHPLCKDYSNKPNKEGKIPAAHYLEGSALMFDNQTGAILAYVGGRDYSKRQFDLLQFGARPPGTALFPFLYTAAFERNYSPLSPLMDDALDNRLAGIGGSEGILGEWGAESNQNKYEGEISARRALSTSKIAASIRLGQSIGAPALVETMKRLGMQTPVPESMTEDGVPIYRTRLFAGTEPLYLKEITRAFSAFSNHGNVPEKLYFIDRIEDSTGYVIWRSPESQTTIEKKPLINPAVSYQVFSILKESLDSGSASQLKSNLDPNFKGVIKTGTNYDFSDNWCMATNERVTCGVWVGFTDGKKAIYPGAFSVDTAGPIISDIVNASVPLYPSKTIAPPDGIESIEICTVSKKRATRFCYEHDKKSSKENPRYIRCTSSEFMRKGDHSLGFCTIHAEDNIGLDDFVSSLNSENASTRILSVLPIIPTAQGIVGQDPYHSEKITPKIPKNFSYDSAGSHDSSPTGAVIVEDDAVTPEEDSKIEIKAPAKIKLKLPETPLFPELNP